jgi:hypothetical protein
MRLMALLMVSGSYLLALGLNCIPNVGRILG